MKRVSKLKCTECRTEYRPDTSTPDGLLRMMQRRCLKCVARSMIIEKAKSVLEQNPDNEKGFVANRILRTVPSHSVEAYGDQSTTGYWFGSDPTTRFILGKSAEILGLENLTGAFGDLTPTSARQSIWVNNLTRDVKSFRKWKNGRFIVEHRSMRVDTVGSSRDFKQLMYWSRSPVSKGFGVEKTDRPSHNSKPIGENLYLLNGYARGYGYDKQSISITSSLERALKAAKKRGIDEDVIEAFVKMFKEKTGKVNE